MESSLVQVNNPSQRQPSLSLSELSLNRSSSHLPTTTFSSTLSHTSYMNAGLYQNRDWMSLHHDGAGVRQKQLNTSRYATRLPVINNCSSTLPPSYSNLPSNLYPACPTKLPPLPVTSSTMVANTHHDEVVNAQCFNILKTNSSVECRKKGVVVSRGHLIPTASNEPSNLPAVPPFSSPPPIRRFVFPFENLLDRVKSKQFGKISGCDVKSGEDLTKTSKCVAETTSSGNTNGKYSTRLSGAESFSLHGMDSRYELDAAQFVASSHDCSGENPYHGINCSRRFSSASDLCSSTFNSVTSPGQNPSQISTETSQDCGWRQHNIDLFLLGQEHFVNSPSSGSLEPLCPRGSQDEGLKNAEWIIPVPSSSASVIG